MNIKNKEPPFNWFRLMFIMTITPCLMMAGIFIGIVVDFGLFPISNMILKSQMFADKYAWIVWFVGFWSMVQIIAVVPMWLILLFKREK